MVEVERWPLWGGRGVKACLQGERVILVLGFTLARGLKIAPVYKQISQVGLPYHLGQLYPLY